MPQEIIDEWRGKDPIGGYERTLLDEVVASEEDLAAIQQRVRREVDAATDEAERSPMPQPEDAAKGVYAGDGYWD